VGAFFASLSRAGGPSVLAECKIIVHKNRTPGPRQSRHYRRRAPSRKIRHSHRRPHLPQRQKGRTRNPGQRPSRIHPPYHALQSLSFPAISTGAYGYPVADAAHIAVEAAAEELSATTHLKAIRFVLFDAATLGAYTSAAQKLHNSGFPCTIEEG